MQYYSSPSPSKMRGALLLSPLLLIGAVIAVAHLLPSPSLSIWFIATPIELPQWVLSGAAVLLFASACLLARFLANAFVLYNEADSHWGTLLATLLFLLFPSSWIASTALLALLPYLGVIFYLYNSYRHPDHPLDLTAAGVFTGLGLLLYPPFVVLIPIILFTAIDLRSLSSRSTISLILGLINPFIIAAPIVLYSESLPHLEQALQEIFTLHFIWQKGNELPTVQLIAVLITTSLYAIAILLGVIHLGEKKVRVRQLIAAQMRPILILPFGLFFSQHLVGLSLLSLIPASMTLALAFPAHRRKLRRFWTLILFASLLIVWTLLLVL